MSTSNQNPTQERIAFDMGFNKLKSSKPTSLCKRVLLLNSLGSLMQATPQLSQETSPFKFQNKEEWRKYMVQEFLTSQSDPDISFKIISSPKTLQVDSLSLLMDCLKISQKKRNPLPLGIRSVRSKTINKFKPRPRS